MTVTATLYLLGVVQGVFLAAALAFSRSGGHGANRYLAALTLLLAVTLVDYLLDDLGVTLSYPQITVVLWPKECLYGVFVYFYVRELTLPGQYPLKGRQWCHFAPAFIHMLITWPLLLLEPQIQYGILEGQALQQEWQRWWSWLQGDPESAVTLLHVAIYLGLAYRLIVSHQRRLLDNFSNTDKISLNWLRNLLVGLGVIYLCWILDELFSSGLRTADSFSSMLGASMVLIIYLMGFLGLRQPVIFSRRAKAPSRAFGVSEEACSMEEGRSIEVRTADTAAPQADDKYRNSPLSSSSSLGLWQELKALMEQKQPFLDSQLSLPQLAQSMGVSANYVSQVINEHAQQNFFDFISGYRVEEVQRLMASDHSSNILELAMASGFNSKSAFYTAFRKHTGKTPGAYRKEVLAGC